MSEQEQILDNNQENLEAKIIARAWKSDAYKQELLENPKAVIAREFDVELPAEVSVQVLEETPTNLYFVLPMRPQFEEGELADVSEAELEAIAGASISAITRGVSKVLNPSDSAKRLSHKVYSSGWGASAISASYVASLYTKGK
ncbi:NHLP leader peptide family natural product precursor [Calothrix sp. FACHB-1219]|uniref:NHLP leader peptide family RiPP precursor n=1 Tax=unclassified Calothrix TaxID=2619626 RepID=UPI001687AF70|nr:MULTISPECIES: NHLP leader peptide family RiPP precursor [unclassified Calothrix]MBD2207944.1 NHLP leader peptide family natural product precursor [Calothrix sp. FACHB-168]MBD2222496.1 NHLP leader peptide family natural product precursor [Calothrix sp. FACHB-1219]